jgi:hypothetical protein
LGWSGSFDFPSSKSIHQRRKLKPQKPGPSVYEDRPQPEPEPPPEPEWQRLAELDLATGALVVVSEYVPFGRGRRWEIPRR